MAPFPCFPFASVCFFLSLSFLPFSISKLCVPYVHSDCHFPVVPFDILFSFFSLSSSLLSSFIPFFFLFFLFFSLFFIQHFYFLLTFFTPSPKLAGKHYNAPSSIDSRPRDLTHLKTTLGLSSSCQRLLKLHISTKRFKNRFVSPTLFFSSQDRILCQRLGALHRRRRPLLNAVLFTMEELRTK